MKMQEVLDTLVARGDLVEEDVNPPDFASDPAIGPEMEYFFPLTPEVVIEAIEEDVDENGHATTLTTKKRLQAQGFWAPQASVSGHFGNLVSQGYLKRFSSRDYSLYLIIDPEPEEEDYEDMPLPTGQDDGLMALASTVD